MSEPVSFRANPNLKRAYVPISFSLEQVQEIDKCASDVYYFLENYYRVFSLDNAEVQYKPFPYQQKLIDALNTKRFVISKMPRQYGKSITLIGYLLWLVLFHKDKRVAILANKFETATKLIDDFKFSYERIPIWMQQGPTKWDARMVKLENGCLVKASATTKGGLRGSSFNLVVLDEFAHVGTGKEAGLDEKFYTSMYPTITSGHDSKIFIISTPLGMNYFYELWQKAVKGKSEYTPIEVNWDEWPGRDLKWKEEQIKNTSAEQFEQEFECQFIGSTNTLLSASCLRFLVETGHEDPISKKNSLSVYEDPLHGHTYCVSVDVSEGVGLDYSAFQVIDVTKWPYKIVATYRDKFIQTMFYPEVIFNVARSYNMAEIIVEHNDVGGQVANMLFMDYEYENMLGSVIRNQRKGQELVSAGLASARSRLGVEMTKSVKKIGCTYLKQLVEDHKLVVNDYDTIAEFTTFIRHLDKYQAEDGKHDDCITPLIIFAWAAKQEVFSDLMNIDIRQRLLSEHERAIEENMLPFPRVWSGPNPEEEQVEIDADGQRWELINRLTDY